MTVRLTYNLIIWEDVKGDNPDLTDKTRGISTALKSYGISKIEIASVIDLEPPKQEIRKNRVEEPQE